MAGKEPETGSTARAVAANVTRLRKEQGLNYKDLSERLKDVAGWGISAVAVRRIEDGVRRVTVDDLAALARVLRVSPATLMMPDLMNPDDVAEAPTGVDQRLTGRQLWQWLTVESPLPGVEYEPADQFQYLSMPHWAALEVVTGQGPAARISKEKAQEMVHQATVDQLKKLMIEGWRPPKAADGDGGSDGDD